MNLHYHRFLVDTAAAASSNQKPGDRLLDHAASLLQDWSDTCVVGDPWTWDSAWNSYAVSSRILNARLARLLLTAVPGEKAEILRRRLDSLGASHAAFLMSWLERDLGGNHLLRNAAALIAAGHWFSGPLAERWGSRGRRLLLGELKGQILPDGFHEERSPMYHSLILEDLLLSSFSPKNSEALDPSILQWATTLLAAQRSVLHTDGQIALFNDAAIGIAAPPHSLEILAQGHGIHAPPPGAGDLASAGYFRFDQDGAVLLFDAGLLGPDHLPAHAHCDALSFEYSSDGRRIVVDTGVDRYEAGPERDFQRSTAAHSTLQINTLEQAEPFGSFRMGRRPRVKGRRLDERSVQGEHDGFRPFGFHRRRIEWQGPRGFTWVDSVEGDQEVPVTVRIGLAPHIEAQILDKKVVMREAGGNRFELSAPEDGSLSLSGGVYCERFGKAVPRTVICWTGSAGRGRGLSFALRPQD